ncbi:MAG: hypothetical protein A2Y16_05255 [Tenericutes bacterium GWF2_57_13]|nr:MAG: hypothetical protein A2Y16_05255 [Tenericutes bacterium GWF2_57_13]
MPDNTAIVSEQREEELRDPLTGLHNRTFFQDELNRIDTVEHLPLTILFCDVNQLKLINDSMGCATGDMLLKSIAAIFTEVCRPKDVLARVANDEFAMILPQTDEPGVERIIERITDQVVNDPQNVLKASVTFGFKTRHRSDEKIRGILHEANQELIRMKASQQDILVGKTVLMIMKTLFERNRYERDHSKNVGMLCEKMGRYLGLNPAEIHRLKVAGVMHDIGKITIDEAILHKKGKLTRAEWAKVKNHAEAGYYILNSTSRFSQIAPTVLQHHERWDGTGYPQRLKGEAILLNARIIAVVEAYDALTSMRVYRNAMTKEEAFSEIRRCSGMQFDPTIVRTFINHFSKE